MLVTYSTLRQDIEQFKGITFDTIVTDEAQAIKNSDSLSHKACLLLNAKHRLALTGTPVENSLDDLFSILNFVSPGLLGGATRAKILGATRKNEDSITDESEVNLEKETLALLSRALKPFILRRTKGQVLKELPSKTENVLHCELSEKEQQFYTELRDFYRANLKGEISRVGLGKSKIVVLEALLRLRQAACHPGLIDKNLRGAESAKVETLIDQLKNVIAEGHKALVFSQFTSFLDIVKSQFEKEKISYLYLDGKPLQKTDKIA